MSEETLENKITQQKETPVRGSLRLTISTSSPQITAGSDFSIFVVIQNPFDVPITLYQVQTHIPIELIDINGLRIDWAKRGVEWQSSSWFRNLYENLMYRLNSRAKHSGVAIAVGTDFDPSVAHDLFEISATGDINMGQGALIAGMQLNFPQNPTTEELDQVFNRIFNYQKGLVPVTLQPGDSVVKQFVLRTRHWLFFTPLNHKFQIQVNYSSDGVDHTDTVTHDQNIRSTIGAMSIGAGFGAMVGTLLKSLSSVTPDENPIFRALATSILASIAVVVAFSRKSSAQSVVSIEDFWGGTLIGFSVGFFGFEQFVGLFTNTPPSN